MRRKIPTLAFCAVCVLFSSLLLIYSLLTSIDTAAVNDRAADLRREIEALEQENELLRAECESFLSLERLETIALEELGMRRCDPDQIIYIELP